MQEEITPNRAAVQPIVVSLGGDAVRLERVLLPLIEKATRGSIAILGGPAMGKTTALRHLASLPAFAKSAVVLDQPEAVTVGTAAMRSLVIHSQDSANRAHCRTDLAAFEMAPWGCDQWIEYALARYRDQCRSIMARLQRCTDVESLDGSPLVACLTIDAFAADESLLTVESAIRVVLSRELADADHQRDAWTHALQFFFDGVIPQVPDAPFKRLRAAGCSARLLQLLGIPAARHCLAVDRVLADLDRPDEIRYLVQRFKPELIGAVARGIDANPARRAKLMKTLASPDSDRMHSTAASILNATNLGWRPDALHFPVLRSAYLRGARWPKTRLAQIIIELANLSGSDLSEADMEESNAHGTVFHGANLHGANLSRMDGTDADFTKADLRHVRAAGAEFQGALFRSANLSGALMKCAKLNAADLTRAVFARADLSEAILIGAKFEECDLTSANLERAILTDADLRTAELAGARFHAARMWGCNLEELRIYGPDFSAADLSRAELTASVMPGANFQDADLQSTGLADVDWEGADLRGANLSNCSFHMGSSRSGRVGSTIASEGTRTGFYTDEYEEQSYLAPEDIRKANLRGADLRGACIDHTDFYLVDLRDALYTPEQESHFRNCGAILESRV